jgi:hypothetical protein
MVRLAPLGVVLVACLALLQATALAAEESDKAQEVFDSLFGSDLKKAQATRDPSDDVMLAAKILDAAQQADGQPVFQALLCLKAAELGAVDPRGYDTATAAADLLIEKAPEKTAAAKEILLPIDQRRFETTRGDDHLAAAQVYVDDILTVAAAKARAGEMDEALKRCRQAQAALTSLRVALPEGLDALSKRTAEMMKLVGKVSLLKGQLKSETTAKAAREELTKLLLVDLDSPEEAAKYLDDASDANMKKYVPALCRKVDEVPELACLEVGDWLRGLAETASLTGKASLLRRALPYYDRFLSLHTTADLDRTKAELAMKKLQADLEKLGDTSTSAGLWIDLLKRLATTKDLAMVGTWQRTDSGWTGSGTTGSQGGTIQVPLVPRGDYELEIRFVETVGNGGVWFHLPVPDTTKAACMLALGGWSNSVTALELIEGKYGTSNPTTTKLPLEPRHIYLLQARVTLANDQVTIAAVLDGKPLLKWTGPASSLAVYPSWAIPQPKCLGLGVGAKSTAAFISARMRMLNGKVVPIEKYTPAPATTPTSGSPVPPKMGPRMTPSPTPSGS